jgi:RNA polymerase sigma factor (TIGR02999 family)
MASMTPTGPEITQLLARWSSGDDDAFDRLVDLVYQDLRTIAHRHLAAGPPDAILDTTVLVHEAYLKLSGSGEGQWPGRAHFFAFCSTVMRRLLIDFARERQSLKRGGTRVRVPLREDAAVVDSQALDILVVEDALTRLETQSPRMARLVECRFFGGMSVAETAEALGTSVRTVERDWTRARAYLRRAVEGGNSSS